MSKRAHIRRRQDSDDEVDNQPVDEDSNGQNSNDGFDNGYENICFYLCFLFIIFYRTTMEDLKLIQKLRQRKNGVSAEELALGKQINPLFSSRKTDVCIFMSYIIKILNFFSQMIHIN
jgi:hypothetical protein